jgi:hypothetical protein
MKGVIGDITASMFMGLMLLAFALGIAFMISLETLKLSRGEKEFYMGEKPPYDIHDLWTSQDK